MTHGTPSPERIFGTLTAYQTSAALAAAIELDLFSAVGNGADTLAALSSATRASERGLRALLNHLVVHQFLEKSGERYRLSAESSFFLDRRSPHFMGSVAGFLNSPGLRQHFDSLVAAVKRGGTAESESGTTAHENPLWVDFARAMQPMARFAASRVAEVVCRGRLPRRVLDIAAGHGLYGIEIAARSPAAELVSQDWANVLPVARENALAAGLGTRHSLLAGSAFDVDWGRGFDLVLLTNFLHHYDRADCTRLLGKARAALGDEGRVALLEFVVNDDRVTPPQPAAFDLVMLATTPHGECYRFTDYVDFFDAAGLDAPERFELEPTTQTLLVAGAKVRR